MVTNEVARFQMKRKSNCVKISIGIQIGYLRLELYVHPSLLQTNPVVLAVFTMQTSFPYIHRLKPFCSTLSNGDASQFLKRSIPTNDSHLAQILVNLSVGTPLLGVLAGEHQDDCC